MHSREAAESNLMNLPTSINRVYLIGAGASVPYGLPAMADLSWEIAESLSPTNKTIFLSAIRECYGRDLAPGDGTNFEDLLNLLNPDALLYLADTDIIAADSTRHQASDVAIGGLRTFIQNKCVAVSGSRGPFDALVKVLDHTSLVVSFNWDVLLELALLRSGREYRYLPSEDDPNATTLLKPHGSINWFALLDREGLAISPTSNLWVIGEKINYYLGYAVNPLAPIKFAECSPMVEHVLSKIPAIVPPTSSKILSVGGAPRDGFVEAGHARAMKAIWQRMAEGLRQARELVIIGYSMPGSDAASIAALKYFARFSTTSNPKRILLVDRNPGIADRYRTILGIDVTLICSDFEQFDPSKL
jgi:hypothetical protein